MQGGIYSKQIEILSVKKINNKQNDPHKTYI